MSVLLALALVATLAGLGSLALSMTRHWRQLRGSVPLTRPVAVALRAGGALSLAVSLALCLAADHATMAALVWIMLLAVGAVVVAFALSRFEQAPPRS